MNDRPVTRVDEPGSAPTMEVRELSLPGSYEVTPRQFHDERGIFLEWYRFEPLAEALGYAPAWRQANLSRSAQHVIRGIHFAAVPPGQAKYVTCVTGAVFDVVVDLRVGSPTFAQWEALRLDDIDRRALYIAEGLGHAFLSLTEGATVSYLCTEVYAPAREFGVHPLDPEIGIDWPGEVVPRLSPKDAANPTLAEAREVGLLPSYERCQAFSESLRSAGNA